MSCVLDGINGFLQHPSSLCSLCDAPFISTGNTTTLVTTGNSSCWRTNVTVKASSHFKTDRLLLMQLYTVSKFGTKRTDHCCMTTMLDCENPKNPTSCQKTILLKNKPEKQTNLSCQTQPQCHLMAYGR